MSASGPTDTNYDVVKFVDGIGKRCPTAAYVILAITAEGDKAKLFLMDMNSKCLVVVTGVHLKSAQRVKAAATQSTQRTHARAVTLLQQLAKQSKEGPRRTPRVTTKKPAVLPDSSTPSPRSLRKQIEVRSETEVGDGDDDSSSSSSSSEVTCLCCTPLHPNLDQQDEAPSRKRNMLVPASPHTLQHHAHYSPQPASSTRRPRSTLVHVRHTG